MKLLNHETDDIAKQVAMKVPFDAILDKIRKSVVTNEVDRADLVNVKDLHNLARDYHKLKVSGTKTIVLVSILG